MTNSIKPTGKEDTFGLSIGKRVKANDNWYLVLNYLGKGSNGTAYLVQSTDGEYKGSTFTMKVFHKMSSNRRKERFLQEIEFMKTRHHPAIMRQYDAGVYREHPFVMTEYYPSTLESEARRNTVDLSKGLRYSTQLLSAVKHLHEAGKIHRDIKPGNIFVNNSSAVLGDFGLIGDITIGDSEDNEDVKGYIAMPRFYRTPELVKYAKDGTPPRKESDVFQLGLVFAYMFSGKNPLKPSEDLLADLELDKISLPKSKYAALIFSKIKKMLEIDPDERVSVDLALDGFNGLFKDYVKDEIALNGKIDV